MTPQEIAKKVVETISAHGAGLSADYDRDGLDYRVTIRTSGRVIGSVEVSSYGETSWTASRRRGLIKGLVARATEAS